MKKIIYLLLLLTFVSCIKEGEVVKEIKLVDYYIEVNRDYDILVGDLIDNHLNTFIITGIYSDGKKSNIPMENLFVKDFSTKEVGVKKIEFEIKNIKKYVEIEVKNPMKDYEIVKNQKMGINFGDTIEKHLYDTFVVEGIWSNGDKKRVILRKENFVEFDTSKIGIKKMVFEINNIKKEVEVEVESNIIFEEGFEGVEDWYSTIKNPNGDLTKPITTKPPTNWTHTRSAPAWAPSTGHDDRLEPVSILEHSLEKVRSGKKSAVFSRDAKALPNWQWKSDGILAKALEKDYKELYVEFYIKYRPDSAQFRATEEEPVANLGKLFRIVSWDRHGEFMKNFEGSVTKPMAGWGYGLNSYGVRSLVYLRGHPTIKDENYNYYFNNYKITGLPRNMFSGDLSLNYTGNIRDLNGDNNKENEIKTFLSAVDRKPIGEHGGLVGHSEMWGDESTGSIWRKVGVFVKMNSQKGVQDGEYRIYIDDNLIFSNNNIPWIGAYDGEMKYWNSIKLGGNDYIKVLKKEGSKEEIGPESMPIPDSLRYQDWYAIDDLKVMSSLPEEYR